MVEYTGVIHACCMREPTHHVFHTYYSTIIFLICENATRITSLTATRGEANNQVDYHGQTMGTTENQSQEA